MRELKPYAIADRALKALNRQAVRRLAETKRALLVAKFDELNVIQSVNKLYARLDGDVRRKLKELFRLRYIEVLEHLGAKNPPEDEIDELVELYITEILDEPNELTHYAYATEVMRKRDRAAEGANAVPGRVQKQLELDKALRQWAAMVGFYVDYVSDTANVTALKDAGIKKVIWHTLDDNRVCNDCNALNGKVFDIDNIPAKPHLRCRCWVTEIR